MYFIYKLLLILKFIYVLHVYVHNVFTKKILSNGDGKIHIVIWILPLTLLNIFCKYKLLFSKKCDPITCVLGTLGFYQVVILHVMVTHDPIVFYTIIYKECSPVEFLAPASVEIFFLTF